jgi:S1-C subfamily serine protease
MQARWAEQGDRVVEVSKPLGCVLVEDKRGDVYISDVTPGSNADRAGLKVRGYVDMELSLFPPFIRGV